jgi:hypothetical protein
MENLKGTNIASPIVPFTDQDIYATHEAKYGKGGYRTVDNVSDLDLIPAARLEEGMLAYVVNDSTGIHTYQLIGGAWVRSKIGRGIPIYNQKLINDLQIDTSNEDYVSIPDDSDLNGSVSSTTYKTTQNGNYVDILFSAIRQLQSEVARLRNSFKYGIESYTEKVTAMSTVEADLANSVEEEPLWAIEEDGLSKIENFEFSLGDDYPLVPKENVTVIIDSDTKDSYLKIAGSATWTATSETMAATDNKMFLFLITNGLGVKANLGIIDTSDTTSSTWLTEPTDSIDLSKITLKAKSENNIYTSLIVISRKKKLDDGKYYGKNFLWVSIGDPATDTTVAEGYYNTSDGKLYSTIQELGDSYLYNFSSVVFTDTVLSKFNLYTKYQDFSKEVIASKPSDESYKFKAAHLTIRSVSSQEVLNSIKDQLLENELIWEETNKKLWIKSGYKLTLIGSSGSTPSTDTGMTKEEMIAALKEMGIVQDTDGSLELSNINTNDITFIHQSSGKKFKFYIDDKGIMHSQEIAPTADLFATKISSNSNITLGNDVRGFIGQVRMYEAGIDRTSDARLYSDRLKIGAFYAPYKSDIVHGCSHSYVELENTADVDFALSGCYLHFTRPGKSDGIQTVYHIALTGIIPAGGTYLVRGAQHSPTTDPNVYLKVETYDQEWYDTSGNLVSFEIDDSQDISAIKAKGYGFALTYGNTFDGVALSYSTSLYRASAAGDIVGSNGNTLTISDSNKATYPYILNQNLIDSLYYYKMVTDDSGKGYWAAAAASIVSNSIYKNTFELDPAKQAFQAYTTKDSSRVRWSNSSNDFQIVDLSKEYITFPHTDGKFAISNYTPKASYEEKNVCTDKTKLSKEIPNMVTSSFGVDIYKTRCFNWVSVGYYPEYVWIKKTGDTSWLGKCQSYIPIQQIKVSNVAETTTSSGTSTVVSFSVSTTGWTAGSSLAKYTVLADSNHKLVISGVSATYSGSIYSITLSGSYSSTITSDSTYYLVSSEDDLAGTTYPMKKFFDADITNNVYARKTGRFPADNNFYTSHKVVVDIVSANVSSPTEYTYVVGRADKNGDPDPDHTSSEMKFTLYPSTYTTQIFQVTDQQGFHWVEYQVWAAVANKVNEKIKTAQAASNIIPILVNTGDMTQNGTRINEWYDYYQGGSILFDHLEQMNVVGNNDLCGTVPSELGTGDDYGKSNSYYFSLFYCYEVGSLFDPLCPNLKDGGAPKFIPSLYYFDSATDRFLMVNSEITQVNCSDWFGLVSSTGNTINIYTGFEITGKTSVYHKEFTSIYTMIWRTLNNAKTLSKATIAACHEMPFTVITNDSLLNSAAGISRSLSNASALIGSHLNQISNTEVGDTTGSPKGIYWFSRLLEYFSVKLVIGGHKHTYSCTYPVRENYTYTLTGTAKTSITDGPMVMDETLENDSANFIDSANSKDLTKFPLTRRADVGTRSDNGFYPCVCVPTLLGGITYFMCQASGYKLTSNKELPSAQQKFSRILPQTKGTYDATTATYKDTPSTDQKYPMFSIIKVNSGIYDIKLIRVTGVLKNYGFSQTNYSSDAVGLQYLTETASNNFGVWGSTESILFTI